jgi:hypothetical protein
MRQSFKSKACNRLRVHRNFYAPVNPSNLVCLAAKSGMATFALKKSNATPGAVLNGDDAYLAPAIALRRGPPKNTCNRGDETPAR